MEFSSLLLLMSALGAADLFISSLITCKQSTLCRVVILVCFNCFGKTIDGFAFYCQEMSDCYCCWIVPSSLLGCICLLTINPHFSLPTTLSSLLWFCQLLECFQCLCFFNIDLKYAFVGFAIFCDFLSKVKHTQNLHMNTIINIFLIFNLLLISLVFLINMIAQF